MNISLFPRIGPFPISYLGNLSLGRVDGESVSQIQLAIGHGVSQRQQVHLVQTGQSRQMRVGQQLGQDPGLSRTEVGQALPLLLRPGCGVALPLLPRPEVVVLLQKAVEVVLRPGVVEQVVVAVSLVGRSPGGASSSSAGAGLLVRRQQRPQWQRRDGVDLGVVKGNLLWHAGCGAARGAGVCGTQRPSAGAAAAACRAAAVTDRQGPGPGPVARRAAAVVVAGVEGAGRRGAEAESLRSANTANLKV